MNKSSSRPVATSSSRRPLAQALDTCVLGFASRVGTGQIFCEPLQVWLSGRDTIVVRVEEGADAEMQLLRDQIVAGLRRKAGRESRMAREKPRTDRASGS